MEDTKEFVERLKRWRDDPALEPDLEKWYNEIYRGQFGQQPIITTVIVPQKPAAKARVPLPIARWRNGIRKLAGKRGPDLDAAVDELKQLFRSSFQADLEFDSGFLKELTQRVKGNRLRKALVELADALNRLPLEATRDNPMFAKLRLGGHINAYGDYNPALGIIRIEGSTFASPPEWAPDRISHAYETLIHEVGHAAHRLAGREFEPFFDEMWALPAARQGDQIWTNYRVITGWPKNTDGMTAYGRVDPLEDLAETWRLLYVERSQKTKMQIYDVDIRSDGTVVYRAPFRRFQLLHDLITRKGWKVPKL